MTNLTNELRKSFNKWRRFECNLHNIKEGTHSSRGREEENLLNQRELDLVDKER